MENCKDEIPKKVWIDYVTKDMLKKTHCRQTYRNLVKKRFKNTARNYTMC